MKKSQKNKRIRHDKASIDLPEQQVWKELYNPKVISSFNETSKWNCQKMKNIEYLLDKAFELLLKKIKRQS